MIDSIEHVEVELGERSYTVTIGQGLLGRLEEFLPRTYWHRATLITDDKVGPLYAHTANSRLKGAGLETLVLEIPAGEASKSAQRALETVDSMISFGLTRADVVFALGGGVVGDLAGFAASVFKRGVDVVQVPTSLMAQVDSSVGGKTAVNIPAAKNQVGTIYQPVAVLCDVTLLSTLPVEEFRSGMAEVVKYSVLTGRAWGRSFSDDAATLADAEPSRIARIVADCVREKAELVTADERDYGVRHYLNYGHTLGHALEAAGGYGGTYSHGEAVAVGMVYAAIVAEQLGVTPVGLAERHSELLATLGLPVAPKPPVPAFADLAARMAQDKKKTEDNAMVLLEGEGKPLIRRGVEDGLLERCFDILTEGRE
ncbi:MAG: 3-dehydroquinate synthase [Candidatus Geothermincolia bacterium]